MPAHLLTVDADGHVLEPADTWERYIDPKFRDRALRVGIDADGYENLFIDNQPTLMLKGRLGALGGIEAETPAEKLAFQIPGKRSYRDGAPPGGYDPHARLAVLDAEGIDKVLLYPTIGIAWEGGVSDPELALAYSRAYNRWIVDFCADSGGRLIPIAQLSLGDPAAAERELRRAANDGVRGVWVPPFTMTRKPLGHPEHHRVFAAAQELGLPLGIHPCFEPKWCAPGRFGEMTSSRYSFFINVTAPDAVRHAFTSLFQYAVFAEFPELRVVVLESGAGWIGYWLDRMDAVYASPQGRLVRERLPEPPSAYFGRQCWISGDPDETSLAAVMSVVPADRFFWASDFPHPDHAPDYVPEVERIVAQLPESARAGFLGRNVLRAFRLAD